MSYWKDGLSIKESKVSVLIVAFIIGFIFTLAMYYKNGEITNNLKHLIETLIISIAGVNIADHVSQFFNKRGGI